MNLVAAMLLAVIAEVPRLLGARGNVIVGASFHTPLTSNSVRVAEARTPWHSVATYRILSSESDCESIGKDRGTGAERGAPGLKRSRHRLEP